MYSYKASKIRKIEQIRSNFNQKIQIPKIIIDVDNIMKNFKILFILLVLFISVGAVNADGNFTSLQTEINEASDNIELTQNYIYDNSTDYPLNDGIIVNKTNFTIDGNGYTVDGASQARMFNILGENVTILNLNLINGFSEKSGGAISAIYLRCENVTFLNNVARENGGSIDCNGTELKNCEFNNNCADKGAALYFLSNATIEDTTFLNSRNYNFSYIYSSEGNTLTINNCKFLNSTAKYAPAIYSNTDTYVKNSFFKDLHAYLSAGAIALKYLAYSEFDNCSFINTSAVKNGGALCIDIGFEVPPQYNITPRVTVKDNKFINTHANFGGAIVHLGANLNILNSEFIADSVIYDGGAIYVSCTNLELNNTKFISNKLLDEDFFDGGGLYCDNSNVSIINSLFENNTKNAIYAYDCNLSVVNTSFSENTEAIHGVFTVCDLKDNNFGNDTLFLNDTYYPTLIEEKGLKFNFINNTINVTTLPTRFDSREWGWVSSVKNQGNMGSCWTFGNCGALESTLIKETGIEYDLSENNMQNSMLKYSKYGINDIDEGGMYVQGLEYLISWLGIFPAAYDPYDEIGKLSPIFTTDENIHIRDAIFIEPRENATDNDALKRAILKCGSVRLDFFSTMGEPEYNNKTFAYYQNRSSGVNHAVSVVGWDDNFSKDNFLMTPPGDGAFIIKNSMGESEGDNGFMYISYYDRSVLNKTILYDYIESTSVGYLLENQEDYTKIYQRDTAGYLDRHTNYTTFKINYQSVGNDLISGVGTYFNFGENYTIELYVNDKLKYTQNGSAPFSGYHTVILMEEIPIKINDNFTVLMKKDFVPIILNSRLHVEKNTTFIEKNGEWIDLTLESKTTTLKVYTKDLTIYTQDLVKIYKNASKFEAGIAVANETVTFEINGVNYTRLSDENGTARIAINLNPGNYTIKTTFNGTTVENNIEVLPTLIAQNLVKYYRNASQFYIALINGSGNAVPNVNITMNINGVFYNRTTNENGTVRLNINLNPGEYILTAADPLTGLQMSYNITVLPTLTAEDLNMSYKDGSKFEANLVDDQGNPLANVNITFNINGVFYQRTTDSNGTAKLNINLMAGEYIITSQYESAVISNKITISAKRGLN